MNEYYLSDYWQNLRQAFIRKYKGCQSCGEITGLQLHHKVYKLGHNFHEEADNLELLCASCHNLKHKRGM